MAELSVMASAGFSLAPFYQDQSSCRSSKEISSIPGYGNRRDILKSASVLVGSRPVEEKLFPKNMFPTHKHPQGSIPMVEKPLLIDVQDAHHDSALLSFGIAEQCARREKILKFLFSGPGEKDDIDTSLLSNLMGLRTGAIDNYDMFSLYGIGARNLDHMLHSARHFHIPRPLLEFISGSSNVTNITVHPNGHMLLSGGVSEIRDLLSVAAEFNILKSFTTSNKQSMVVPYFTRSRGGHARPSVQESVPSNQTAALLKSPENMKLKPSSKKRSKNASRDRDLYQANYFRACEILLSVVVDKKNNSMAILSLKKSGPEITQLLSKFSAGIAGTGLAILLSVACKTATGKVLPSSAKVLNAGLGIGFFWLSWAVNRLRETVSSISRSSNKLKLTEEEIVGRIDGSINEVLFRALALVAIVLLRFA